MGYPPKQQYLEVPLLTKPALDCASSCTQLNQLSSFSQPMGELLDPPAALWITGDHLPARWSWTPCARGG